MLLKLPHGWEHSCWATMLMRCLYGGQEVVIARELGDGRYAFAFVATLGQWRLQLFARGLPLAPIDFVVVQTSPPRPLAPRGSLICSLGAQGKEAGEFRGPMGAACDSNEGLVFVADCYNHRVQVFFFHRFLAFQHAFPWSFLCATHHSPFSISCLFTLP